MPLEIPSHIQPIEDYEYLEGLYILSAVGNYSYRDPERLIDFIFHPVRHDYNSSYAPFHPKSLEKEGTKILQVPVADMIDARMGQIYLDGNPHPLFTYLNPVHNPTVSSIQKTFTLGKISTKTTPIRNYLDIRKIVTCGLLPDQRYHLVSAPKDSDIDFYLIPSYEIIRYYYLRSSPLVKIFFSQQSKIFSLPFEPIQLNENRESFTEIKFSKRVSKWDVSVFAQVYYNHMRRAHWNNCRANTQYPDCWIPADTLELSVVGLPFHYSTIGKGFLVQFIDDNRINNKIDYIILDDQSQHNSKKTMKNNSQIVNVPTNNPPPDADPNGTGNDDNNKGQKEGAIILKVSRLEIQILRIIKPINLLQRDWANSETK